MEINIYAWKLNAFFHQLVFTCYHMEHMNKMPNYRVISNQLRKKSLEIFEKKPNESAFSAFEIAITVATATSNLSHFTQV